MTIGRVVLALFTLVICLAVTRCTPDHQASGATVGQTAITGSAAIRLGEPVRSAPEHRCRSARRGVSFYIRAAWHWARLSHQPRLRVRTAGRSCRQARNAVLRMRTESRRARLVYELWRATPKLTGETPWHTSEQNPVNRNIMRIGTCETGGKHGQDGVPDWDHHARAPEPGHYYEGAFGFLDSTWASRRWRVRPLPPAHAYDASPAEQLAVARALVREFRGYSSWPSCHRRLGLAG